MQPVPAATVLETHEVTNQPGPFAGRNLYMTDPALRAAVEREAGAWLADRLAPLGEKLGSAQVLAWGMEANRCPPELAAFDAEGRRLDEVRFHPAYHALMDLAMVSRVHDLAWTDPGPGAHCAHAAMLALFTQAEAGVMCPINMTYAAVPVLRANPEIGAAWEGRIVGGSYDAPLAPIEAKRGVTMGMAMTEKQGGSDVRANTTCAVPDGAGAFVLRGHKWFCSAPMSDGFLTLAYTDAGLSCFLVPRVRPDGTRNSIHLMRLKDKLGNRSNASAEIEYHDAYAALVGEEGRGVATIIEMVHHTRLGTASSTLGIMRAAFSRALQHVRERRAFQKRLIDQPLMRRVLADLALDYEAAVALVMRVAARFEAPSPEARAFARLSVALTKYLLTKRCPTFVAECMECLGGNGYVEDSQMPRLYREAPVNAIWEGSGNVIALDVLRTLRREPEALDAWLAEVGAGRSQDAHLDRAAARLKEQFAKGGPDEADGRHVAEWMALILQGALLIQTAPSCIGEAFCATRLGADPARTWGAHEHGGDVDAIIARALGG